MFLACKKGLIFTFAEMTDENMVVGFSLEKPGSVCLPWLETIRRRIDGMTKSGGNLVAAKDDEDEEE